MISDNENKLIGALRSNGRVKINALAREVNIPKSTLFELLGKLERNGIISHKSLVRFEKIGFPIKLLVALQTIPGRRQDLINHLSKHENVNSLHMINSGFDVHFEAFFKDQKEAQDFLDLLDMQFPIRMKNVYNVIETIEQEKFTVRGMK